MSDKPDADQVLKAVMGTIVNKLEDKVSELEKTCKCLIEYNEKSNLFKDLINEKQKELEASIKDLDKYTETEVMAFDKRIIKNTSRLDELFTYLFGEKVGDVRNKQDIWSVVRDFGLFLYGNNPAIKPNYNILEKMSELSEFITATEHNHNIRIDTIKSGLKEVIAVFEMENMIETGLLKKLDCDIKSVPKSGEAFCKTDKEFMNHRSFTEIKEQSKYNIKGLHEDKELKTVKVNEVRTDILGCAITEITIPADNSDDFNEDGTLKEGTCINCAGCNRTEQSKKRKMVDELTCEEWHAMRTKITYEIEFNTVHPESPKQDIAWLCAENLALILNQGTKYNHDFKVKQLEAMD